MAAPCSRSRLDSHPASCHDDSRVATWRGRPWKKTPRAAAESSLHSQGWAGGPSGHVLAGTGVPLRSFTEKTNSRPARLPKGFHPLGKPDTP